MARRAGAPRPGSANRTRRSGPEARPAIVRLPSPPLTDLAAQLVTFWARMRPIGPGSLHALGALASAIWAAAGPAASLVTGGRPRAVLFLVQPCPPRPSQ
jgi:hypothetical protein